MYEQGSFESVPFVFSSPFVSPSPSQSAAAQIALLTFGFDVTGTQGSSGLGSVLFGAPSPSQSNTAHINQAVVPTIGAFVYEQGSSGSVPFVYSVPLFSPSPSQSDVAHATFVGSGVEPAGYTQASVGSGSTPFGAPSPSQSNAAHTE